MQMQLTLDILQPWLYTIRSHIMTWSAKRPILALSLVIFSCVMLLPIISATALMPIIFLLNLSDFIATKGMIYVIYTVLFQGFVLGLLLVILFFAAFAIATSASVLHSHKYFYTE